ncbi:hypothetical protein C8F04DRAFT_947020 [Mycena alexandri]|uniref:F-box domain-containing protein n=1 Tax=Mycena alexandri TaxID=1745969 RepID=A0AAD6XAQ4_9AGAR|nr:hypothetical protein C8F04DRAFT_947020 [Mycena alexandri]
MSEALPDEIISEILSPVLKISEEMFSNIEHHDISPFASPAVSSSATLVVCKAWLRVATPLLYHVVVIRSKAQARALERTLRDSPDLGRFIKRLRLEGGFGPAMEHVLDAAPNLTDIFLSLQIHAPDSTAGLLHGLPRINPTRMILWDDHTVILRNKHLKDLMQVLETFVMKWNKLTTLKFSFQHLFAYSHQTFLKTLCTCPTLRKVTFPLLSSIDVPFLKQVARLPALEVIETEAPNYRAELLSVIASNPRLLSLVRWREESWFPATPIEDDEPMILRPTNPSSQPLASSPQAVVDRIWSRSLEFAMLTDSETEDCSTRLPFLLVSKTFHRLALPYLYRYLAFPDEGRLHRLAERLTANPDLGMHIREIEISGYTFARNAGFSPAVDLTQIFRHTPRLIGRDEHWTDHFPELFWPALEALGEAAGGTLQELTGFKFNAADGNSSNSPAVFVRFTALRSLTWECGSRPILTIPFFFDKEIMPANGLPALESLRVESSIWLWDMQKIEYVFQLFLLAILTHRDSLPNLRQVDLNLEHYRDPSFLLKHGNKIEELKVKQTSFRGYSVLTLCPQLRVLACEVEPQDDYVKDFGIDDLPAGFQHTALATLILTKESLKVKDEKDWKHFFDTLDLAYFPALREIRVLAIAQWPTTEHAISKSPWVKLAERLLQNGVHLTDNSGYQWHPRLKASRARR